MTLTYVKGDATLPVGAGPKIIVHVCNDIGKWGRGFVLAVSGRWPHVREAYVTRYQEQGLELGEVQLVEAQSGLWIANVIGQRGIRRSKDDVPLMYDALDTGLSTVAALAAERNATVHMPRIGNGLAGGKWEHIEPLIRARLVEGGVSVTVYDWVP